MNSKRVGKALLSLGISALCVASCSDNDNENGGGTSSSELANKLKGTTWVCIRDTCYKVKDEQTYITDLETSTEEEKITHLYKKTITFFKDGTCLNEVSYGEETYGTWTINGNTIQIKEVTYGYYPPESTSTNYEDKSYTVKSQTNNTMNLNYTQISYKEGGTKKTKESGNGVWEKVMDDTDYLFGTWQCDNNKSITLKEDSTCTSTGMESYSLGNFWHFTGDEVWIEKDNSTRTRFKITLKDSEMALVLSSETYSSSFFKKVK